MKPNDFGLFDILGNVWQWCETPNQGYPRPGSAIVDDNLPAMQVAHDIHRVLRGGAYNNLPGHIRSAYRAFQNPESRQSNVGFRPVQTISLQSVFTTL